MSKKVKVQCSTCDVINLQVASEKLYIMEMNEQKNIKLIMNQQYINTSKEDKFLVILEPK